MRKILAGYFSVLFCLCVGAISRAGVTVTVDHNGGDTATAEFKFKNVPSPNKNNAASNAKFSISDGDKDDNGGDLEVLHDGKLPTEQDAPTDNFFFNAGSDGGRLVIDLGSAINIKQFNTYSWHTDTRAPQVYTLYGSDGSVAGFNGSPSKEIDPAKAGWTLITKVDTRPKTGDAGGQYGVSISDPSGSIGTCRYLLLVAEQTESDDTFGNTFYSEINVIDSKEMIAPPVPAGDKPGVKLVEMAGGKFTATIDTTETPDLTEWADKELAPVVVEWYPQLVEMLPSEGYSAPTHFSITFRANKDGVADTAGTRINCAAKWFRGELEGQAKGAIVHEMVHVVQQYGDARRTNPHPTRDPGWLIEGIPDYLRWHKFEPKSNGDIITKRGYPHANFDGSYRITSNFLDYVISRYDKDLIKQLNAAMRQGVYTDDIWKKETGKTLPDLNDEWKASLAKSLQIAM